MCVRAERHDVSWDCKWLGKGGTWAACRRTVRWEV